MVRQGRVSWSGPNSTIPFLDQIFVCQNFIEAVTPVFANLFVKPFGECLGEPVGKCFRHYRAVVIVFLLKFGAELFEPTPRGDDKGPDVVRYSRGALRNEIGQGVSE